MEKVISRMDTLKYCLPPITEGSAGNGQIGWMLVGSCTYFEDNPCSSVFFSDHFVSNKALWINDSAHRSQRGDRICFYMCWYRSATDQALYLKEFCAELHKRQTPSELSIWSANSDSLTLDQTFSCVFVFVLFVAFPLFCLFVLCSIHSNFKNYANIIQSSTKYIMIYNV